MLKRYDLIDWTAEPHNHYVPLRGRNLETDIQNAAILPRINIKVPGSIYDALQKAGLIEDPFFDMNSLKALWVAGYWWEYRTKVELPVRVEGERIELVLEGIDYKGHVFFNGHSLGISENMYVPFVADVTDIAKEGQNSVVVVIENAPDETGQIGRTSRVFTQKARFNYKWDWCTRLISIGLYRPAYIRTYQEVRIKDFYFKPVGLDGDAEVYVDLHGDTQNCQVKVEIGGCVAQAGLDKRGRQSKMRVHVDNVRLWYPNNEGEQYMYDLTMTVIKDGQAVETMTKKVGFRQITLEQNDNAPVGALGYVFTCNGKKVYARGVNLTPIDHTCYNDPAKMEALLTLMKKANMNLIRVWGGGVIEDDVFYDLCDRMGFMVWQEFIQSSSGIDNIPSKIESFLENQAKTAEWATKHLRNHPSLSVWSGGNELMDAESIPSTFADRNIGELLGIVTHNSPHTPMLPTSASGPWEGLDGIHHPGENHDVHGSWRFLGVVDHYTKYNRSDSLFHSEFGVDGMTCMESLKKFLSEENLKPSDMQKNFVWRHHGEWWDTAFRDKGIFGAPETLEQMVARSQYVQAEGLRYIVEANRRNAFHNSGSIIWQINEPFPNLSCTSLIDYYMQPKPVFWQVAKAFAPLNVSLKYNKLVWDKGEQFTAEVYVSLDGEEREVEYSYTVGGETVTGKVVCGNTQGVKVGEIKLIADGKYIDIDVAAKTADKTYTNTIRLLVKQENGLCADDGLYDFYDKVNA